MEIITARFPAASHEDLVVIRRFIEAVGNAFDINQKVISELVLAVHEAAVNVIIHGYKNQPGPLIINVAQVGDDLQIKLRDQAPTFDPTTVPIPDTNLPLGRRSPGGMGIHMMRSFTDELRYRVTAGGENELVLVKYDALPR